MDTHKLTTLFVDPTFSTQTGPLVWASSAGASAEPVDSTYAYDTLAMALGAAEDGDVIRVCPGTHLLPATIDHEVLILGLSGRSCIISGDAKIPISVGVRLESCEVTAKITVQGRLGILNSQVTGQVISDGMHSSTDKQDGAVVFVSCTGRDADMRSAGAFARYPQGKVGAGGPTGRNHSLYRHKFRLEAPAQFISDEGVTGRRWVTVQEFAGRLDERSGSESSTGDVHVADTSGRVYCRGGLPVHTDMALRHRDRIFQIVGTRMATGIINEFEMLVNERVGGV